MQKSKYVLLQDLVMDDAKLNKILIMAQELNIFDVLGVTKAEIRHSRMIAWFLDPNERHGLNTSFLKEILKAVIRNAEDDETPRYEGMIKDWILTDFSDVMIERETSGSGSNRRVDIILTAKGNGHKYLIAIENKVDSKESCNQTADYYKSLTKKYKKYDRKMFVFLTPNGDPADDCHWCKLSYEDVINALETATMGRCISDKMKLIIDDYITAVRRGILGDPELIKISDEIYETHKDAIDILLEKNRRTDDIELRELKEGICKQYQPAIKLLCDSQKDVGNTVAQYIRKGIKLAQESDDNLIINDKYINKKAYIRLNTKKLTKLFGGDLDEPVSPWKSKESYYYEFDNRRDRINFYLVLGGGEYLEGNSELKKRHLKVARLFGARDNDDYSYKRVVVTESNSLYLDNINTEEDRKKITDFVCSMLSQIPKIESRIEEVLINE